MNEASTRTEQNLGGFLVDFFSTRELTFTFGWSDPSRSITFAPLHLSGFDFLFVLAFILGLLTMNALTTIRDEGEVDRQVVLDELLGEARESFRAMSSVPVLGFVSYFHYDYLRRVPGLDVAFGVTAYQLAFSAKAAVTAATRGREAVRDIADQVSNVVSYAVNQISDAGELGEMQAAEIARHATRGAIHAVDEVAEDVGHLAKGAVLGAISALSKTVTNHGDILREVGYGAVQGAGEVGADVAQAATHAVAAAKEVAHEMGLLEEEAAAQATQGVLEAAEPLGPATVAEVKEALISLARRPATSDAPGPVADAETPK